MILLCVLEADVILNHFIFILFRYGLQKACQHATNLTCKNSFQNEILKVSQFCRNLSIKNAVLTLQHVWYAEVYLALELCNFSFQILPDETHNLWF